MILVSYNTILNTNNEILQEILNTTKSLPDFNNSNNVERQANINNIGIFGFNYKFEDKSFATSIDGRDLSKYYSDQ